MKIASKLIRLSAITLSLTSLAMAADSKPNIIVIMADDVGHECFGAYGSEQYQTPNIDRLAQIGIQFSLGYSQPVCTPSRVKIMTGKSNVHNYVNFACLDSNERTFGHILKDAGYATCIAGKWQLAQLPRKLKAGQNPGTLPAAAGFDEHYMWQVQDRGNRYWKPTLTFNGKTKTYGADDYGPQLLSEKVLEFIERKKDQPFFVYYPMVLVHSPFPTTPLSEDKNSKDNQKNFEDMIFYMDHLIGDLVNKLEALKIRDNTLILFLADNGTHGSLRSQFRGKTVKGAKGNTIDYGIHVPFIANWTGVTAPQQNQDLIHIGDILPTITELAGVAIPEDVTGKSFAPLLTGTPYEPREFMYMYYNSRPLEASKKKIKVFAQSKTWKLYTNGELYHYAEDILEKAPFLENQEPERASTMRKKLQQVLDQYPAEGVMNEKPFNKTKK